MKVKQTTFRRAGQRSASPVHLRLSTSSLSITGDQQGLARPLVSSTSSQPRGPHEAHRGHRRCPTPPLRPLRPLRSQHRDRQEPRSGVGLSASFVNRIHSPMINEAAFIKMEGAFLRHRRYRHRYEAGVTIDGPSGAGRLHRSGHPAAIMDVLQGDRRQQSTAPAADPQDGSRRQPGATARPARSFYVYNADRCKTAVDAL